jgi:hypothetical protein
VLQRTAAIGEWLADALDRQGNGYTDDCKNLRDRHPKINSESGTRIFPQTTSVKYREMQTGLSKNIRRTLIIRLVFATV